LSLTANTRMGHSDISVTLNTYTHVKFEDAKEEMARLKVI